MTDQLITCDTERGKNLFQRLRAAKRAEGDVRILLSKLIREGLTEEEVSLSLERARQVGS